MGMSDKTPHISDEKIQSLFIILIKTSVQVPMSQKPFLQHLKPCLGRAPFVFCCISIIPTAQTVRAVSRIVSFLSVPAFAGLPATHDNWQKFTRCWGGSGRMDREQWHSWQTVKRCAGCKLRYRRVNTRASPHRQRYSPRS